MKVVALVPMRHHSVRVPGKNYRLFNGKPLFHYILQTLLTCKSVDKVLVDTDSQEIVEGIRSTFPSVGVIKRPEYLCGDSIPMNEILMHDINQTDGELFLQTHSTNPLLKVESIEIAINELISKYPQYDSLFSVTEHHARFWDPITRPINHNPQILLRTQDLPPIYEENSCIYIFNRKTLQINHNRIGSRPLMFLTNPLESWDIDEESDFIIAEQLMILKG